MTKQTGHLWAVLEEWLNTLPWKPSQNQLAERIGVSASTLGEWKYATRVPKPAHLEALARETHLPYDRLLDAVNRDRGYEPRERRWA